MELKKNKKYELEPKRPFHFGIGMVIALSLALVAFEWKSPIDPVVNNPVPEEDIWYVMDEVQITRHEIPEIPKPKPEKQVFRQDVIVKEVKEVFETIDEPVLDQMDDIIEDLTQGSPIPVEVPEDPFLFVEEMPEFPGGEKALLEFIAKNIRYPGTAQRLGVEGRVHLKFVIDKDGSVTNIEVLQGIGAGCDKEAIRVLGLLPKFSPGKQRGKAVKVQMQLPVIFKLK